jgi:hypothetical protein
MHEVEKYVERFGPVEMIDSELTLHDPEDL